MRAGYTCDGCHEWIPSGYIHTCGQSQQPSHQAATITNMLLAEIKNLLKEIRDEVTWIRAEMKE